ncbi:MAG TPA: RNA polymerase sigma-70 factor [Mucilaginibacter sp.]|nr:RNA polymerase sigma-70 factor [Mucilaginibacter sp.]
MSDYKTLNEHELANRLRLDDDLAFSEIYLRYWDKLYVLSRNRLGDAYESEEVVQDIFCNLWRRRHTFVLQNGFNNYFSVAVKFEVINRLSKLQKAAAYEKEMADVTELDQSTLQQLDLNELLQQLQQNINSLPEKCRIVFRLQYEQGYTQRQIAQTLDISEKTVEAHLAKARRSLRNAVGNPFIFNILIILFLRSKG